MIKNYVKFMKLIDGPVSKVIATGVIAIGLTFPASVLSAGNQEEPFVYLVKYTISGDPIGPATFEINGPGYSTITTSSGEVLDNIVPGLEVSQLSGAQITLSGNLMPPDPIIPFTCAAGTCNITLGGSTFTSDAGVPLDGRAVPMWGPVINSEFVPNVSTPVRILGCGGLKEISGEGEFAGMVGSICFNGTFTIPDFQTNFTLTGSSDCTITLHTPVVSIP